MITCEQCGKINGHEKVGTSWICEDCKADEVTELPDHPANPEKKGPPNNG